MSGMGFLLGSDVPFLADQQSNITALRCDLSLTLEKACDTISIVNRDVAQPGSAHVWGA